jgi:hypothetical protein
MAKACPVAGCCVPGTGHAHGFLSLFSAAASTGVPSTCPEKDDVLGSLIYPVGSRALGILGPAWNAQTRWHQ